MLNYWERWVSHPCGWLRMTCGGGKFITRNRIVRAQLASTVGQDGLLLKETNRKDEVSSRETHVILRFVRTRFPVFRNAVRAMISVRWGWSFSKSLALTTHWHNLLIMAWWRGFWPNLFEHAEMVPHIFLKTFTPPQHMLATYGVSVRSIHVI